MSPQKMYGRIPMYILVILTMIFCAFTIGYEKYAATKASVRLQEHALIIADDLWNFNVEGAAEYLELAADTDHYETLNVYNHNGEIFQAVSTSLPTTFEKICLALHLTPRVVLITTVESKTNVIGWIEAVWIPQTLYIQLYVLAILILILASSTLYCRLFLEKRLLKERVVERTNALSKANKVLQREYTERIQAEEEQKKLQQQLEQSKKMESLGLLAGGVAHDLNNVLSGIVSYPDLLLHDMEKDHPMRRIVATMKDSGLRAAEIIQDLLTLARRGVVTKQLLNLNVLAEEYFSSPEYAKLLEYSPNIEISLSKATNLSPVMGSPTALKKILMNLISNGTEAQPNGGCITIETRNRLLELPLNGVGLIPAGEYVLLRVRDEGEGIASENLQQIFEPFYTRKVMGRSGTGLGLTVVWGTVEDHDGFIDVHSEPSSGTTIDIYLPISKERATQPETSRTQVELAGNHETILIIDDVDYQRDIASAILTRLRYEVTAVPSGEEAIDYLKENSVDLLVLDMILDGGIDGLETYKRILELHPEQRAIIASGFSENDQVHRTQALGAGICIKKPYTLDQLSLAVWKELGKMR